MATCRLAVSIAGVERLNDMLLEECVINEGMHTISAAAVQWISAGTRRVSNTPTPEVDMEQESDGVSIPPSTFLDQEIRFSQPCHSRTLVLIWSEQSIKRIKHWICESIGDINVPIKNSLIASVGVERD